MFKVLIKMTHTSLNRILQFYEKVEYQITYENPGYYTSVYVIYKKRDFDIDFFMYLIVLLLTQLTYLKWIQELKMLKTCNFKRINSQYKLYFFFT